jgi:RNA polymerase sigma-70 factor (ECF subfamily)
VSVDGQERVRRALELTADDLLRYFERRVHVPADAADLLSDTMLQAWRRADACPDETSRQRMWLFTIAANVLSNHHRGTVRSLRLANRLREHFVTDAAPDHADPSAVRDAVLRLRRSHRELIMLVHWDGLTILEAAELLGLNASTARSRYSAARSSLREALMLATTAD